MDGNDLASLAIRIILGVVMFAHGYRHAFGGGKLAGTARWFASIGIQPAPLHALLGTVTELIASVLLLFGFLTPIGGAMVIGTMGVAFIANHLKNGFFIFNPGEGYEYVLTLLVVAVAVGALGGGTISLDNAFGIADSLSGAGWGLGALLLGGLGAATVLATSWRKPAAS
jgi:putative oxidoreductase